MKESIENFGSQGRLCGTLCAPAESSFKKGNPCIIMLNSGLIYQAGPFRLHTEMARELAQLGFYSFRFDLSGIGDSNRSRENIAFDEQTPVDIESALAHIEEKTGVSSFVLMGICTGADNAHKHALKNDKVTGAIFLDGYAYKTPGYYMRYYLPRIFNPAMVFEKLGRLISSSLKSSKSASETQEQVKGVDFWNMPTKEKTLEELSQLVDRNVHQLHVFTHDWIWCFNHQSQFDSMYKQLDFNNTATCVYLDQSDHTYTMIDDRLKLIDTVSNWLESSYATSS